MSSHTSAVGRIARMAAAALVTSMICIPAIFAEIPSMSAEIPSVTVNYSDLNLSTVEGSRALYVRLVAAAQRVCPRTADTVLALRWNREAQRCVHETVERAVKSIENPQFAQVAASFRE